MSSEASMLVPTPPTIKRIERISPTLYEAAMKCTSRAAWLAGGDGKLVPPHPRALLGTGVHAVLERARAGGVAGTTEDEWRSGAERFFDEKMRQLFAATHPLLHAKFDGPDRLPFYNLFRARAAQMAADAAASLSGRAGHAIARSSGGGLAVEAALVSKDGRVAGRADVLDSANATVIDYKTGAAGDSDPVTESELRQLRLYAYLANQNGIAIARGVIERADRSRAEVPISAQDAAEEGRRALVVLDGYNQHAGKPFESGASPSPDACRFCPCIPFCEAFWRTAEPQWIGQCGTHVEGVVESVEGGELVSINLNATRGTGANGPAVVTRLSREWLTFSGAIPQPQQTVRVTDAAYVEESTAPAVFRADRVTTAVWTVRSQAP
ncbi:PD-(D/E)XK nuclease family protein [Sorangium atrum]|uniref:PD-(D/E)XK nuclease family protein n=1 Tax=Sorangium atrum TaxID=2995308 RepID=A0ABT5C861_9BACT|nr:PD-(D/E)XK nuclease family protein [Sorangium aterium]MDC0682624.1 PD-(D/E)XK nuclease family protein [Sorangium aterium]